MARPATPSRRVWPPEPGYFRVRLVRGGWQVPAKIEIADGKWAVSIDGAYVEEPNADPALAGAGRVWHYGDIIPEDEYRWLLDLKDAARTLAPSHPCLHPRTPIDPNNLTPLEVA